MDEPDVDVREEEASDLLRSVAENVFIGRQPLELVPQGGAFQLTFGIEEEYQIIDPETRELQSYITQILEADHIIMGQVKPELHQSIVEVGTTVCHTPAEVRDQLIALRGGVMELAGKKGLKIAAAGTHPFSHWANQEITPLERYIGTRQAMAQLALEEGMSLEWPLVSLEPFLWTGGKLLGWAQSETSHSLARGDLPIPSVRRRHPGGVELEITAFADGPPDSTTLHARYRVRNGGTAALSGKLFVAARPLQVNPPWQFLSVLGGFSPIRRIARDGTDSFRFDDRRVRARPSGFGATGFDAGEISTWLVRGDLPRGESASDADGFASAAAASGAHVHRDVDPAEIVAGRSEHEVGVSRAVYGLADTGSVVLAAGPDEPRARSLLPPVHVTVLDAERILPGLPELFAELRGELPSALAIVTGPSRSADIEQKLVLGVHGPGEVHIIIRSNVSD